MFLYILYTSATGFPVAFVYNYIFRYQRYSFFVFTRFVAIELPKLDYRHIELRKIKVDVIKSESIKREFILLSVEILYSLKTDIFM